MYIERIKEAMERRGWSVAETARRSGMPISTLSRILNRSRRPSLNTIQQLARTLGVTIDFLAGEEINDITKARLVADAVVREVQTRYGIVPSGPGQRRETPVAAYIPGVLGADFSREGFPMGEPVAVVRTRVDYPDTWVAVVKGDGYSPRLLDGWRLFCCPRARWKESDIVVVRSRDGSLTAGTIQEHRDSYTLGALNPSVAPKRLDKTEVEFIQRIVAIEVPLPDEEDCDGEAPEGDV